HRALHADQRGPPREPHQGEGGRHPGEADVSLQHPVEKVVTRFWDHKDQNTLKGYKSRGGYQQLAKALDLEPAAVIDAVKKSNLRGRGGAGFPTGMKWSFLPKDNPKPKYLCINAD